MAVKNLYMKEMDYVGISENVVSSMEKLYKTKCTLYFTNAQMLLSFDSEPLPVKILSISINPGN